MNRRLATMLTGAMVASCLAAAVPAKAGIVIQITPPAFFIATTSPVYYEGRAHYWYGNAWYYRDGHTWRTYRAEPRYLHDYRSHHEPERHYYGHRHDDHYDDHHHGERH